MLNDQFMNLFAFESDESNFAVPDAILHSRSIKIVKQDDPSSNALSFDSEPPASLYELLSCTSLFEKNEIVDIEITQQDDTRKTIQITQQELQFNHEPCQVMSFRDISS